jgi:probable addiction module antidote protein
MSQIALETMPYDAAEFLTDEETISAYLTEALESNEPRSVTKALDAVVRARTAAKTWLAGIARLGSASSAS